MTNMNRFKNFIIMILLVILYEINKSYGNCNGIRC